MSSLRTVTLADVARDAGVSAYTASVVLNGARPGTRVSSTTRQRILESAHRLSYPFHRAAGTGREANGDPGGYGGGGGGHRGAIGVLFDIAESTDALRDAESSAILQGVVEEVHRNSRDLLLYTDRWRGAQRSASRFRDCRADGVIVIAPLTESDAVRDLAALGVPLCAVAASGELAASSHVACGVDADTGGGVRQAVHHLFALGHRRIAYLAGDDRSHAERARGMAFCAAIEELDLDPAARRIECGCGDDASLMEAALSLLFSLPSRPTAIVAASDAIAIAVLREARRRGVDVPGSLSVIGFGDRPEAALASPPLTTVWQPLREIGSLAVRRLIDHVSGQTVTSRPAWDLLATALVIRHSTASPPSLSAV